MECEKLAQEKTEMQRHYVMVRLFISLSLSLLPYNFLMFGSVITCVVTGCYPNAYYFMLVVCVCCLHYFVMSGTRLVSVLCVLSADH